MFVNHIIKPPACFGHSCLTIFRGPLSEFSAVTTSLLVCVVKLLIWYVAVCYLCVCVPDVLVCGTGTHTHRQHTATYQINNLTTQTSIEVVTALSSENGPLKMVKQD